MLESSRTVHSPQWLSPANNGGNFLFVESLADLQPIFSVLVATASSAATAIENKMPAIRTNSKYCNDCFGSSDVQDEYISEMDYAFLDRKPGVVRRAKKGRRHAGEELLQKQISNRAYLIKKCDVDANEKRIGKKRRARLVFEHLSDFNLSVPYSLNRKNRWSLVENVEEHAQLLGVKRNDGALPMDGAMLVALAESEFTHNDVNPGERLNKYHIIDGSGSVTSYNARSSRGAAAKDLMAKSKAALEFEARGIGSDENRSRSESEPKDGGQRVNVEYLICKPHPKMFASKYFKGRNTMKSPKREVNVIAGNFGGQSKSSLKENEQNRFENDRDDVCDAKRNTVTYSLADFVKEGSPPVFVKSPPSSKRKSNIGIENQYNFVSNPSEFVVELDDKKGAPRWITDFLDVPKNWTFEKLKGLPSIFGIEKQQDWLSQCQTISEQQILDFRWLNNALSCFSVDLTRMALSDNQAQPSKPLLVLSIRFNEDERLLNVLINSVKRFDEGALNLLKSFLTKRSHCTHTIYDIIKSIADEFRSLLEKQDEHCIDTNDEDLFKGDYNGSRLTDLKKATKIYDILESDVQKYADWENQFVGPEELCNEKGGAAAKKLVAAEVGITGQNEEDCTGEMLDDEDFELVDLCDLAESDLAESNANLDSCIKGNNSLAEYFCGRCEESDRNNLIQLKSCGHRFCLQCLSTEFIQQLSTKNIPLRCLNDKCGAEIALWSSGLLRTILPLPLMNKYVLVHLVLERNCFGVSNCQNCKEHIFLDQVPKFRQITCEQCNWSWCNECLQRPHFPLTCAQHSEWAMKFAKDYVHKRGENSDVVYSEKERTSVQQYYSAASESFLRRFDSKQGGKLSKNMSRITNYKMKRQVLELRKTALHILEFGNAWLFLTKGKGKGEARPQNWGQIKSMLVGLRDALDGLENEILFTSLSGPSLIEKVNNISGSIEKILLKFTPRTSQP